MMKWLLLLGGLLVWAAHFFLLYAIASIFPGQSIARTLSITVTGIALVADALIIWHAVARGGRDSGLEKWTWQVALAGGLLSFIAVLWQGIPALI